MSLHELDMGCGGRAVSWTMLPEYIGGLGETQWYIYSRMHIHMFGRTMALQKWSARAGLYSFNSAFFMFSVCFSASYPSVCLSFLNGLLT